MPNHLAQANSLYLRKHADNPIAWWFWCDQALEMARQENKPIFLSIGYSSCHWCTVMEGEAFSDLAIADYMNTHFLPIKVDREERPDLDSIYMQALQMMVGQGGWPLNIFLSPEDLVPFYGGTYFPVDPRYGRPGFLGVLQAVRRYYDQEKGKLEEIKSEILGNLQGSMLLPGVQTLSQDLLWKGLEHNTGIMAARSQGTCFPMIPYAEVAARSARFATESPDQVQAISTQRGLDLALGGIFDHVGGGFHRYTVDPTWTVPHFEKMLYDNGQIVEYLANLWAAGVHEPAFERAIALTVQWLQREMTASDGYFYAAQDADSFTHPTAIEPEEGAFYVWDYTELTQLLTPEALTELTAQFTVSKTGNFEKHIVLQRHTAETFSDSLESVLNQLFRARYGASATNLPHFPPAHDNHGAKTMAWSGRIPPVTDTKMIVAWNSLMISGLARSAAVFQRRDWLDLAAIAAQFILSQQWVDGRFHRVNYQGQPHILAQSEDYALLIKALLDLNQAAHSLTIRSGSERSSESWDSQSSDYLNRAIQVQQEFDQFLWSLEGGYYNTDDNPDLLVRERSYSDHATPAANGIAVTNLVRLALLTDDLNHLDRAEHTLQAFASVMERSPQACPSLFTGLDWFQHHVLVRTTRDRLPTLSAHYFPTVVYRVEPNLPDSAVGLVCQGLTCQAPAQTMEHLLHQIQQSQIRA
jgi:uncharacterized protein YyaL (SSP411 family)